MLNIYCEFWFSMDAIVKSKKNGWSHPLSKAKLPKHCLYSVSTLEFVGKEYQGINTHVCSTLFVVGYDYTDANAGATFVPMHGNSPLANVVL